MFKKKENWATKTYIFNRRTVFLPNGNSIEYCCHPDNTEKVYAIGDGGKHEVTREWAEAVLRLERRET